MPRSGCLSKSAKLLVVTNIQVAVLVEVGNFCSGRSVHRKEEAFVKVVLPVVFQDPDPVIRLQHAREVKIVAVHIDDIHAVVAVEIMH